MDHSSAIGATHAAASEPGAPASRTLARGCFVTGTDTGVGKTLISCALIHALRRRDLRVAGMKPVATGNVLEAEDALALRQASSLDLPLRRINSFLYEPPIAPHLAAAAVHRPIRLTRIRRDYALLSAQVDWMVVEGAGGWMVPLGPRLMLADVPRALRLPVVLVVGMRLGCLNHALLSARSIQADGLRLCGWVGSVTDSTMRVLGENLQALRQRLPAPCLGVVPHLTGADLPQRAADHLDLDAWFSPPRKPQ